MAVNDKIAALKGQLKTWNDLAAVIELFDNPKSIEVGYHNLEMAAGVYLRDKIVKSFSDIEFLNRACKKLGFTEKSPFDSYGLFYVPSKGKKVVVVGNKLAVIDGNDKSGSYSARRIWTPFNFENGTMFGKGTAEFTKNQDEVIMSLIRSAEYYSQYSDNVEGRPRIQRPDLRWYKDKDFEIVKQWNVPENLRSYGDARDPGYIFTLEFMFNGKGTTLSAQEPDYAKHYSEIAHFLYDIKDAKEAVKRYAKENKVWFH